MSRKLHNLPFRAARWLLGRPGAMLLLARDEALAAEPPQRFRRAWLELAAGGLGWGVTLTFVWGAAWRIFGGHHWDNPYLPAPAAVTLAFFCLGPFAPAVAGLARQIGGASAERRATATAVIVVGLAMCLLRLHPDWHRGEPFDLPWWIGWVRPQAKLYRVLLLMPAWGSWSMLVTPMFCQPSERTEPQVSALARGCDAIAVAAVMGVLLAISIFHFHYLGLGGQVSIPLTAVVVGVVGGAVFCRLSGGLCRRALLSANLTTQIALILAYLAAR